MELPTTKKESLQFGLLMCFGMVLVMTMYNFSLMVPLVNNFY